MASDQVIQFEEYELDLRRAELRCNGEPVLLEPQVFNLVAFFASNPGRVLSRDELIDGVWDGRIVSDSAIATRINAVRHALGDDGRNQRVIRTVSRRGFVFVPNPVLKTIVDEQIAIDGSDATSEFKGLPLPEKPSVAVLPFNNLAGDPNQDFFADGITDDIITELSRYDELFVIARHSSFTYRDAHSDVRQIAATLGVRYVLEGSVRRLDRRVRINVQLIDAVAGNQLWTERYDRELQDIFAVQDEVTGMIVNTLVGQLTHQHYRRALQELPREVDAYDHALRAMIFFHKFSPEENKRARAEVEAALSIDPEFARAHAILAWTYGVEGALRWVDDPMTSFQKSLAAATNAISINDLEPWGHSAVGYAEIMCNHAFSQGLSAFERSVSLNPNNAHFRSWYSIGLCFAGHPEQALQEIEYAIRLNPHYPPIYLNFLGRILFVLKRFKDALPHLERLVKALPHNTSGLALTAACYAALGRHDEAKAMVEKVLVVSPNYHLSVVHLSVPYARFHDLEYYNSMLRQAGLPE